MLKSCTKGLACPGPVLDKEAAFAQPQYSHQESFKVQAQTPGFLDKGRVESLRPSSEPTKAGKCRPGHLSWREPSWREPGMLSASPVGARGAAFSQHARSPPSPACFWLRMIELCDMTELSLCKLHRNALGLRHLRMKVVVFSVQNNKSPRLSPLGFHPLCSQATFSCRRRLSGCPRPAPRRRTRCRESRAPPTALSGATVRVQA